MDENSKVNIKNIKTGSTKTVTIKVAAQEADLDADDIIWAINEDGECETDLHVITPAD